MSQRGLRLIHKPTIESLDDLSFEGYIPTFDPSLVSFRFHADNLPALGAVLIERFDYLFSQIPACGTMPSLEIRMPIFESGQDNFLFLDLGKVFV